MNLAQDDPNSGIPWGRPSIPAIPVPPFENRDAARAFVAHLSAYVALLGGDGPVGPTTFALLTMVQQESDRDRWTTSFDPLPSRQVLILAMVTYFPAPWTPHGLNDVIADVLGRFPRRGNSLPGRLGWESDPSFSATRNGAGHWQVTASERGTDDVVGRFATDDDMVLYRMSFARSHPMPFGWSWDDSAMGALGLAAEAARTAWTAHARLPYLTNWRR